MPESEFSRTGVVALWVLTLGLLCSGLPAAAGFDAIHWNRLRPLDSNPALDSGVALNRACVPGETVVLGKAVGSDSAQRLALRKGQFVICIGNTGAGQLQLVDGPGNRWTVGREDVNATRHFPANWQAHDRDYLVWAYNRDTIVFRESLGHSFEGNFFYLLLDRAADGSVNGAILIDSGTGYADLAPYLESLIGEQPLLVVSTHSHWDHFGGHRHLRHLANVELLGYRPGAAYNPYPEAPEYDLAGLRQRFGLDDWPASSKDFTIGQRRLAVLPIPGHTRDSLAIYDYREQLLFTGDTVCPCYLFIERWEAYADSLERLAGFAAQQPVRWLLGGHVEMSRKRDWNDMHEYFYFGSNAHWDSLPVQMPPDYLESARAVVAETLAHSAGATPQYDARAIDQQFHARPLVPIPFPGIPPYFRRDSERLVDQLRDRHRWHDARRARAAKPQH
jgi:glyoxylase-like metal-dependent hydrolase (beta-lactamase superfamily II)